MPKNRFKKSLARILIELIFPVTCVECGQEGEWLCDRCFKQVPLVRPEQCALCRKAAVNGLCDNCRQATGLEGIVSLFDYHDPAIQKLIKTLKYINQADVAVFLAGKFGRQLRKQLPSGELAVTYVPLSRDRQASRGFNQAELLARYFIGDDWPVFSLVKKSRATSPQAKLNKKDRAQNLRGAFTLTTKHIPDQVIIFDDVVTTGATVSAIAKLLKKAGAQTVWAVTVAHD